MARSVAMTGGSLVNDAAAEAEVPPEAFKVFGKKKNLPGNVGIVTVHECALTHKHNTHITR